MGDSCDCLETSSDVRERMRIMVRQRKLREFEPTVAMLMETVADPAFAAALQSRNGAFAKRKR